MSDNTETIIQYLDGELTGEDLKQFEELLQKDETVRQELNSLELAQKAVMSYGLNSQVASVHGEMMNELKIADERPAAKIYPFIRITLKIAASLLLVLSAVGAYQYIGVSPAKLFNEDYKPYQVSVVRGAVNSSDIEKAYIAGKPATVISLYEKMDTANNKVKFLAGQSYLDSHQAQKAIHAFDKILNPPSLDGSYKDDAEYYQALAYIENNQPSKALVIFKKIYNDKDHLYHDQVSYWALLKLKILVLKTSTK